MSSSRISSNKSKGNAVLSQEQNTSAPPILVFTLTGEASRASSGDINNHDYEEQTDGVKSGKTNSMTATVQNTQEDSDSNNTSFNSITSIEDTILLPKTTMLQSTTSKEEFDQLSLDRKTDELFSLIQGLLPLTHQIATIQTTLDTFRDKVNSLDERLSTHINLSLIHI